MSFESGLLLLGYVAGGVTGLIFGTLLGLWICTQLYKKR